MVVVVVVVVAFLALKLIWIVISRGSKLLFLKSPVHAISASYSRYPSLCDLDVLTLTFYFSCIETTLADLGHFQDAVLRALKGATGCALQSCN